VDVSLCLAQDYCYEMFITGLPTKCNAASDEWALVIRQRAHNIASKQRKETRQAEANSGGGRGGGGGSAS